MASTPGKKPKASVGDAIARARAAATPRIEQARAAAAPRIEQASAAAAPRAEKAAQAAGSFLGTLRERAKETAKQFSDGYGNAGIDGPRDPDAASTAENGDTQGRPRPRPRPGRSQD